MHSPRDPQGIAKAKRLRRDMSPPERSMWALLRAHRLEGWKFTRQVAEGPYVIDFAARRERLAIELDGETHTGRAEYDANRSAYLERAGWRVIRFSNSEIAKNPEGVSLSILSALSLRRDQPHPLSPTLSPAGRGSTKGMT